MKRAVQKLAIGVGLILGTPLALVITVAALSPPVRWTPLLALLPLLWLIPILSVWAWHRLPTEPLKPPKSPTALRRALAGVGWGLGAFWATAHFLFVCAQALTHKHVNFAEALLVLTVGPPTWGEAIAAFRDAGRLAREGRARRYAFRVQTDAGDTE